MTQIVVMKGWEGFADRLQILSHLLHYCKLHGAAICVDWRDHMWGQTDLDFSDYFEILDIPVVPLSHVLERMEEGASILPAAFTKENIAAVPQESTRFSLYLSPLTNAYAKIDADIVVHNCNGVRTFHIYNLISNIRLTTAVSDIVCERLAGLQSPYTAVHLRGTDRLSKMTISEAMQPAVAALQAQPPHVQVRQYVLSDMKSMCDLWLAQEPNARTVVDDYSIYKLPDGTQGTHQMAAEVLEFYGIKKHDLNVDTLTDFLILCFANWSVGNSKDSLYTQMSTFMRQGGKKGVANWVHGFEPNSVSLK